MKSDVKEVPGFPGYFVDQKGVIYSNKRSGGELIPRKLSLTTTGYYRIGLNGPNKNIKRIYAHRIVAMTHIPNPKKFEIVNHKNGIKTDNRVSNLEWTDAKGNARHYQDHIKQKSTQKSSSFNDVDVLRTVENLFEAASASNDPSLFHTLYNITRLSWKKSGKTIVA